MKQTRRQKIRKSILLVMVLLFPIVFYYFSPYLVIAGGSEGIIVGSFIIFVGMFVGSLFLGRLFCGWLCPWRSDPGTKPQSQQQKLQWQKTKLD